ncbi:DUF4345 family protein [Nocardia asteroides]|uniref:DUF4345 family protein n=1 Tax=Nocardia asteroides TaxID=1824 RepID=UPI001E285F3C|nr:DUF4345 family protein [Nocardia asteroides]UGT63108.1 DUF4345 family protein [Nocardia asteroides]
MRISVLALAATGFVLMGLAALAAPDRIVAPFGMRATTPAAASEVRAVYGGFGIALAGVLAWAATGAGGAHTGAVLAAGIALLGMAGGRLLSRLLDPGVSFYPVYFYLLVELVSGAALCAVA